MKLLKKEVINVIRITISKRGEKESIKSISLLESTTKDVAKVVEDVLSKQRISPMVKGKEKSVSIQIREYNGSKYEPGSVNFSVIKFTVADVYDILINEFKKLDNE